MVSLSVNDVLFRLVFGLVAVRWQLWVALMVDDLGDQKVAYWVVRSVVRLAACSAYQRDATTAAQTVV